MAGRAAAGTMPARVTLTSRRRPAPLGTTVASPHYLPAPPSPAWGSATPAQPHTGGWGFGPASTHSAWGPAAPRAAEPRWHPAHGHNASLCQALAPARWETWDGRGSPHPLPHGKGGGRGPRERGPRAAAGCCYFRSQRVANAVEGLHSRTGENESPRKGSAAPGSDPAPQPLAPQGPLRPLGAGKGTRVSGPCIPPHPRTHPSPCPKAVGSSSGPSTGRHGAGGGMAAGQGAAQPLCPPGGEGGGPGSGQPGGPQVGTCWWRGGGPGAGGEVTGGSGPALRKKKKRASRGERKWFEERRG